MKKETNWTAIALFLLWIFTGYFYSKEIKYSQHLERQLFELKTQTK